MGTFWCLKIASDDNHGYLKTTEHLRSVGGVASLTLIWRRKRDGDGAMLVKIDRKANVDAF